MDVWNCKVENRYRRMGPRALVAPARMKQLATIAFICAIAVAACILAMPPKSSDAGSKSHSNAAPHGMGSTQKPPTQPSAAPVEDASAFHLERIFESGGWAAVMSDINASVAPDSRVGRSILAASKLIYQDSSRTSSILSAMPAGAVRHRVMVNLAGGTSPEVARTVLGWVLANGFADEVTSVYRSFSLRTLTIADEEFITKHLDEATDASAKPLLLSLKAQALAARGDVQEVSKLLSDAPASSLPRDYDVSIIGSLSRGGHLNAETISSLPPPLQKSGWKQLAYEASNGDEASGIEWINNHVPSDHRAAAAGALFSRWVHTDPMAASEAVRALPPGDVRTSGIKNLVGYLKSKGDVAAAAAWEAQLAPQK